MSKMSIRLGWFLGIACSAIAFSANCASAQITPDGTLPNNSIVTPNGSTLNITGGTQAGGNLFHSFSEFSVLNGGTAFFNNAVDIQNIISRVTGGSVSKIDGLIRANGTANLFLINPNGIIFGPNAELNVGGSFAATTANAIGFGNQGFFSATNPNSPELLTVNPSAFLFNQISSQPSSIQVNEAFLSVDPGQSLLLVGGDVNLQGAQLVAIDGRIELGGLAEGGRGGNVRIRAIDIFGTQVREQLTSGSDISATGEVELNVLDVDDLSRVNLPTVPLDTKVSQVCQPRSAENQSSFVITGRGGLPPNPRTDLLSGDAVQVDWVTLNPNINNRTTTVIKNPTPTPPQPIIEATGWVRNEKGEVVLTANPSTVTPHSPWITPASCNAKT